MKVPGSSNIRVNSQAVSHAGFSMPWLYDVNPTDPTFVAVAAAMTATALLACWGPAFKAAFVDPIVALRNE
jgi:ABC-type antimicrobial peptide transport system permease subunit